jgi:hypothetical protein
MDVGCVARMYSQTNNVLTDVSSWMDRIARAKSGATDRLRIFFERSARADSGTEFVKTTSVSPDSPIRSTAGPDSTACVAQADTLAAP